MLSKWAVLGPIMSLTRASASPHARRVGCVWGTPGRRRRLLCLGVLGTPAVVLPRQLPGGVRPGCGRIRLVGCSGRRSLRGLGLCRRYGRLGPRRGWLAPRLHEPAAEGVDHALEGHNLALERGNHRLARDGGGAGGRIHRPPYAPWNGSGCAPLPRRRSGAVHPREKEPAPRLWP